MIRMMIQPKDGEYGPKADAQRDGFGLIDEELVKTSSADVFFVVLEKRRVPSQVDVFGDLV